jgi:upstream activation factor subunit UAF30
MSRVFNFSKYLLAAASSKVKASPASFAASSAEPVKKVVATGFNKPMPVSPAMRKFLGVGEISRAQVMKKIWEHIKLHSLQVWRIFTLN